MKMAIVLKLVSGILLLTCFSWLRALAGPALDIRYQEIAAVISPSNHSLEVDDKITVSVDKPGKYSFLLGKQFKIKKITVDGKKISIREVEGKALRQAFKNVEDEDVFLGAKGFIVGFGNGGEHIVEVSFEGIVYDTLKVPDYSRGAIAEETTGIISDEGVYLSGSTNWYPHRPNDFSFFNIKVKTPPEFESITEGKRIAHTKTDKVLTTEWEALYPTHEVTLVAGRYIVQEEEMDGITLMAYFFESEKELIPTYLKATRRYIDMYNSLIGPYPFSKFAIVENFFPTGYGMPSYTLLGKRVIRLPFIVYTSLGHEIAHNWWGNCVYPDYSEGNWCEGLTVYFADYRYKEAISDSAAADYRRTLVTDFTSYVNDDNDFPLSSFKERTTSASRAIGYGKGAFVFHMLRRILGDETFYRTLRTYYEKYQFKVASWDDIEDVFEKTSGKDLHYYFDQWVQRRGAPLLSLESAEVDSVKEAFEVHVRLKQNPVYRILVPIYVSGADTSCEREVWLASGDTTIGLRCGFKPLEVKVDSRYDVFRRLDPFEVAPTISAALGDEKLLIVLPTRAEPAKRAAFDALAAQLNRTGESTVKEDTTVTVADLEKSSLLVLGGSEENLLLSIMNVPPGIKLGRNVITVAGRTYSKPGNSAFIAFRSPFNARRSVCAITGGSVASVEKSGYKIIHYGKYSFVTFIDGNKIDAGVLPVEGNPMAASLE